MIALNAEALLRVWEESLSLHPIRRALALLAAAWPEINEQSWAAISIGERDACLLWLHDSLFGCELRTTTRCPQCGDRLESTFHTHDIRANAPCLPALLKELRWQSEGYEVHYRLPASMDLLEVTHAPREQAAAALFRRCILDIRHHGAPVSQEKVPARIIHSLTEEMAKNDPDAHIEIGLSCPCCDHPWKITFDIITYVWSEIDDWAQRILEEVHLLASAYGWSERDILSMNPSRRRLYLELVQS